MSYDPDTRKSWESAGAYHEAVKPEYPSVASWPPILEPAFVAILDDVAAQSSKQLRVLHPCCNDGRELLWFIHRHGWCGLGVDYVQAFVDRAQRCARRDQLAAEFRVNDVLAAIASLQEASFDIAIMTLGTLWWFADIAPLLEGLARVLRPSGHLCIWEFHPIAACLDEDLYLAEDYPMVRQERYHPGGVEDYVSDEEALILPSQEARDTSISRFVNDFAAVDYIWPVGSIVERLCGAGFRILKCSELTHVWGERYRRGLVPSGVGSRFTFPSTSRALPLTVVFDCIVDH